MTKTTILANLSHMKVAETVGFILSNGFKIRCSSEHVRSSQTRGTILKLSPKSNQNLKRTP